MAQWVYQLKSGKELREAVDNKDYLGVLENLEKCWREIHENLPDYYDEDELADDLAEIKNQKDNLKNYEEYDKFDMTLGDIIDEIDFLLTEFYDFCDNTGIWVNLD